MITIVAHVRFDFAPANFAPHRPYQNCRTILLLQYCTVHQCPIVLLLLRDKLTDWQGFSDQMDEHRAVPTLICSAVCRVGSSQLKAEAEALGWRLIIAPITSRPAPQLHAALHAITLHGFTLRGALHGITLQSGRLLLLSYRQPPATA